MAREHGWGNIHNRYICKSPQVYFLRIVLERRWLEACCKLLQVTLARWKVCVQNKQERLIVLQAAMMVGSAIYAGEGSPKRCKQMTAFLSPASQSNESTWQLLTATPVTMSVVTCQMSQTVINFMTSKLE